ncbi:hypothetical protein GCM10009525_40750 [Streptosporangium amethystogenes subsp. fukuiense]
MRLVEFNGERDHVRLLVGCPPKVVLAALVDSLKGVSARLLRKEYPTVRRYLRGGRLRSPSYVAASRGGALLRLVKKYIENQERPDQRPDVHNPRTGKRFLPGVNTRGSSLDNAEAGEHPDRPGRSPGHRLRHRAYRGDVPERDRAAEKHPALDDSRAVPWPPCLTGRRRLGVGCRRPVRRHGHAALRR